MKMIMKNFKGKVLQPNHTNVLLDVKPNAYRKEKTDGGLIIPSGQLFGSTDRPQLTEEEQLELIIGFAEVVAVGPDCKWLKAGDEVYIDTRSCRPVPFGGFGYELTNEQNVLCKINE